MWKEENVLEKNLQKDRKTGREKHVPNTQEFRTVDR